MRSFFALAALLLTAGSAWAQWLPDVRLTDDPASSQTEIDGGRNVVVADQLIMVVWTDTRDGSSEIYFQERLAGTWSAAMRLTDNAASSTHPAIGRVEGEVRVVWEDDRSGHPEIRMKRKVAGVWQMDTCLTCDEFESARPSLDHTGEHLAWEETKDGNREVYYRRMPFDAPWETDFRVSNDAQESSHPSVASPRPIGIPFDTGVRLVAWQDHRDGNWEIYARFGTTFNGWGPERRVSSNAASSQFPSAAVEDDAFCGDIAFMSLWVAWQDDRHGNDEIYFAEGFDGLWEVPFRFTNTALPSQHPSVGKTYFPFFGPFGAGICGIPTLTWEERTSETSGKILYQDFSVAQPETISAGIADPTNASLAAFHEITLPGTVEGTLAVAWTDERDGNEEIYLAEGASLLVVTGAPEIEIPPGAEQLEIGLARPNPFRSETTATVVVSKESTLSVRIVDAAGRLVRELFSGAVREGTHSFTWDGAARSGKRAASGTYFFVAESEAGTGVRSVIRVQ